MGTYTWSSSVKKVCLFCPIFSVIYLSQCGLMNLYFLLWVVIQWYCCLLSCSSCSCFGHWSSFRRLLYPCHTFSFLCVWFCFLSSFLLFGIILYFSCSSPEISLFSKELLFLLLENGIQEWSPGPQMCSLLLGYHCFQALCDRVKKCRSVFESMYTQSYSYFHMCLSACLSVKSEREFILMSQVRIQLHCLSPCLVVTSLAARNLAPITAVDVLYLCNPS